MDMTRAWRKSTYSGADSGNCIEAASRPGTVAVRDSRNPDGPRLAVPDRRWRAFTRRVQRDTL